MKPLKYSLLSLLFLSVALSANTALAELQTVPSVDVTKYLGTWYQIAHIPLFFEGGNCACAKQELSVTPDPKVVHVFNSCSPNNANRSEKRTISGEATDLDTTTNSKFSVSFQGVPFSGSYWIIGLDSLYRYAVVSDSWSYSLYILSKTPTLPDDLYNEAVATAARQLDVSSLVKTDQNNCTY